VTARHKYASKPQRIVDGYLVKILILRRKGNEAVVYNSEAELNFEISCVKGRQGDMCNTRANK